MSQIFLAIDHFDNDTGRPMPNGIPQEQLAGIDDQDHRRLDYPRIFYYLKQCNIEVSLVRPDTAPVGSWYPMVLGFFDFAEDYLALVSPNAYQKIKQKQMLLVLTYHEGDNPVNLRSRIDELCQLHNVDPAMVWLISGNSAANQVDNCVYWPELEFMYWRTVDLDQGAPYHVDARSRKFTALCRIDKLWRSVFMSELWAKNLHTQGYFSYNQFNLGSENNYFDCALNNIYLEEIQPQVDRFIAAGPFRVDQLDSRSQNDYAINLTDVYKDSYFNVVLETMIDVDGSGGVFATEKTFKPIFNNQFFIEVSSAHTLEHLKELGYQTFGRCIDESYDSIESNQERFQAVLETTQQLASLDLSQLHLIYQDLAPEIQHNYLHFKNQVSSRLTHVVSRIQSTLG